MKAIVIRSHGDASVLTFEEEYPFDEASPLTDGQVLVKNEYAGLNFIDTYFRTGLYHQNLPFIAGQEGGGIVVESTVPYLKKGDTVAYMAFGSYAQYTKVPADKCVLVPEGMDLKIAIACMVQGLTAHYLVTDATAGLIKPDQWCLIYSVASGTTQWAAQMAKLQGYKVIGTTSRTKVESVPKDCVDELIVLETAGEDKSFADYSSVDIVKRVMDITNGEGCHCVLDGVGKSTADTSVASLARRGIWITFGNASGPVPDFSLLRLAAKSAFVTRPKLGDYTASPDELQARANQVFDWLQQGSLTVCVDRVFPLKDAAEGHRYLESGKSKGKILFEIGS